MTDKIPSTAEIVAQKLAEIDNAPPTELDLLNPEELIDGHRRYITCTVGDEKVQVRIPLHVWKDPQPHMLRPYVEEMRKLIKKAREK